MVIPESVFHLVLLSEHLIWFVTGIVDNLGHLVFVFPVRLPPLFFVFHLNFGNNGCFYLTYISTERKEVTAGIESQFQDKVTLYTFPCL